MTQVLVGAGLVVFAIALARAARIGLERDIAIAAVRATVQLAVAGAFIALVFEHAGFAVAFIAVMLGAATLTAGRRLAGIPHARARALTAIAGGAAVGVVPLLVSGAYDTDPHDLIPLTGILVGGAMAATSVTGHQLRERVKDHMDEVEARLALGDAVPQALAPLLPGAVTAALIPIIDQTKNVGLVTLPGTFVGLLLGGASPAEAARTQLTVLLALLAVEVVATLITVRLGVAGLRRPGERIDPP
jgi:putative ABC transport system permease protein